MLIDFNGCVMRILTDFSPLSARYIWKYTRFTAFKELNGFVKTYISA